MRLLAEELSWEPSRVVLENDTNAALLAEVRHPTSLWIFYCNGAAKEFLSHEMTLKGWLAP